MHIFGITLILYNLGLSKSFRAVTTGCTKKELLEIDHIVSYNLNLTYAKQSA